MNLNYNPCKIRFSSLNSSFVSLSVSLISTDLVFIDCTCLQPPFVPGSLNSSSVLLSFTLEL